MYHKSAHRRLKYVYPRGWMIMSQSELNKIYISVWQYGKRNNFGIKLRAKIIKSKLTTIRLGCYRRKKCIKLFS